MAQLYDALCSWHNLAAAWARLRHCQGVWSSGVPMAWMWRDPVPAMLELAEDLRRGRYQPQPPQRFCLQRADGTPREIVSYCIRDRLVQRAALQVIQPLAERLFLPSSFGFRPCRSVPRAVAAAQYRLRSGCLHVADADTPAPACTATPEPAAPTASRPTARC